MFLSTMKFGGGTKKILGKLSLNAPPSPLSAASQALLSLGKIDCTNFFDAR